MREKPEWTDLVIGWAEGLGWKVMHIEQSRREVVRRSGDHAFIGDKQSKGFPDLLLVRGQRIMAVELKRHGLHPEAEQAEWMAALEAAGLEVHLWWPTDNEWARRLLGRIVTSRLTTLRGRVVDGDVNLVSADQGTRIDPRLRRQRTWF